MFVRLPTASEVDRSLSSPPSAPRSTEASGSTAKRARPEGPLHAISKNHLQARDLAEQPLQHRWGRLTVVLVRWMDNDCEQKA